MQAVLWAIVLALAGLALYAKVRGTLGQTLNELAK